MQTVKPFIIPEMTFKDRSMSLAMVQIHKPNTAVYLRSGVTTCLSRIVSEIFNVQ